MLGGSTNYCDSLVGTFSVLATRSNFDPVTFTERHQTLTLPELHDPADRPFIKVQWDRFPTGRGRAVGSVRDQHGRPIKEFHLSMFFPRMGEQGWNHSKSAWTRTPVIDPEGRFEVNDLPAGEYGIYVTAFDPATYTEGRISFRIPDEPGPEVRADVDLERCELRYGWAVFDDGTPVAPGGWGKPDDGGYGASWPFEGDGFFRAALPPSDLKDLPGGKIEVRAFGAGGVGVTTVRVPWNSLSKDPEKPYLVVLKRPGTDQDERQLTEPADAQD